MTAFLSLPELDLQKANKSVKYLRRYRKGGKWVYVYADKKGGVDKRKLFSGQGEGGAFGVSAGDRFASPIGGILDVKAVDPQGNITYKDSDGKERTQRAQDFRTMIERFHGSAIDQAIKEGFQRRELILYEAKKNGNPKLIERAEMLLSAWESTYTVSRKTPQEEEKKEEKKEERTSELTATERANAAKAADALVSLLEKSGNAQEEALAAIKKELLAPDAAEGYEKAKKTRSSVAALFVDVADNTSVEAITLSLFEKFSQATPPAVSVKEIRAAFLGHPKTKKWLKENTGRLFSHSAASWNDLAKEPSLLQVVGKDGENWAKANASLAAAKLPPITLEAYEQGKKKDKAVTSKIKTRKDAAAFFEESGLEVADKVSDKSAVNVAKLLATTRAVGVKLGLSANKKLKLVVAAGSYVVPKNNVLGQFSRSSFELRISEGSKSSFAHEMWHARDWVLGEAVDGNNMASARASRPLGSKELSAFTTLLASLPRFRQMTDAYRDEGHQKYAAYLATPVELFARFGEQLTSYRVAQAAARGETATLEGATRPYEYYQSTPVHISVEDFPRIVAVWESLAVSKIFEDTIAKAL